MSAKDADYGSEGWGFESLRARPADWLAFGPLTSENAAEAVLVQG